MHDHWEEVYVVQGDLVVGNDKQGKGGEQSFAPTYACRPPGVHHGPSLRAAAASSTRFTITKPPGMLKTGS